MAAVTITAAGGCAGGAFFFGAFFSSAILECDVCILDENDLNNVDVHFKRNYLIAIMRTWRKAKSLTRASVTGQDKVVFSPLIVLFEGHDFHHVFNAKIHYVTLSSLDRVMQSPSSTRPFPSLLILVIF